jgi:hypothetical protein
MIELKIINRVLAAFNLQAPITRKVQKRIYRSKERTFKILGGNEGSNPAETRSNFLFQFGGTMKKIYLIAASIAAIVIGTGLFLTLHKSDKNVQPTAEIKKAEAANVIFVIGDTKVKHDNGEFAPLSQGDKLAKNDIVLTGKKSNVLIQVGNLGVMKILENTEFSFKELNNNGFTEVFLSQGGVYSKIIKLEKDNSYRVKTPTCVAAVRGTQFLAQYDSAKKGKSEIQVLDGKVAVKATETSMIEKIAEDGKGIDSSNGKLKDYTLTKIQTIILQKHAVYDYIEDLESKKPDDLKNIQENIEKKEKELDAQLKKVIALEERADPLEKLRKQGKPLTMVYLRDGSQIAGSIISADETTMLLDTGEGTIKLPIAEILRRLPMK